MEWTEEQREEVARILEMIAEEGLPHPRHLDAALDAISCTTFDNLQQTVQVDIASGLSLMEDEKVVQKMSQLIAPALVKADPFASLATIIDATVTDPHVKKMLEHNLGVFQKRLREAQHAH
jgi:hypothetical protein